MIRMLKGIIQTLKIKNRLRHPRTEKSEQIPSRDDIVPAPREHRSDFLWDRKWWKYRPMNNSGTSAPSGAMSGPWGSSTPRRDLPELHRERDLRIEWVKGPGFPFSNSDKREDFAVPKQLWVSDRSDLETRRNATDVPKIKNRLGIPRTENEVVEVFFGDFRFPTWRVQKSIIENF